MAASVAGVAVVLGLAGLIGLHGAGMARVGDQSRERASRGLNQRSVRRVIE
jgi:hypothetical protein